MAKKTATKAVPKYVLNLLERRRRLAAELADVNCKIYDYCEKIGMDFETQQDACLLSDVRIYTEFDGAYGSTLEAIEKTLNGGDCE